MSSNQDILEYLKTKTFIPHENGNYARYGLNLFGCDSIIQYDNKIWKFKDFISNTNHAVYIDKEGREFVLDTYNKDGIIRMQEA
jgi:hypothetical protein